MQNSNLTDAQIRETQIRKKFLVLQDQLLDYDIDEFRMFTFAPGNDIVFSMKALIGEYTELIHVGDQFMGVGFIIPKQQIEYIAAAIIDNEKRMKRLKSL